MKKRLAMALLLMAPMAAADRTGTAPRYARDDKPKIFYCGHRIGDDKIRAILERCRDHVFVLNDDVIINFHRIEYLYCGGDWGSAGYVRRNALVRFENGLPLFRFQKWDRELALEGPAHGWKNRFPFFIVGQYTLRDGRKTALGHVMRRLDFDTLKHYLATHDDAENVFEDKLPTPKNAPKTTRKRGDEGETFDYIYLLKLAAMLSVVPVMAFFGDRGTRVLRRRMKERIRRTAACALGIFSGRG